MQLTFRDILDLVATSDDLIARMSRPGYRSDLTQPANVLLSTEIPV